MIMGRVRDVPAFLLLGVLLVAGCAPVAVVQQDPPTPTTVARASSVYLLPDIPAEISQSVAREYGLSLASQPSLASCVVEPGSRSLVGSWVYALVAPFNTIPDDVGQDDFARKWKDGLAEFPAQGILVAPEDLAFLSSALGAPDPQSVKTVSAERLLQEAWRNPNTFAIIPFGEIRPEWKVISLDRINPIEKHFEAALYPLTIPFSMRCNGLLPAESSAGWITNRDPDRLTTIILTGTTAMVRGTAAFMETRGTLYPGTDVRGVLREADFLHISNEIPYSPQCPLPWLNPGQEKLRFCSAPKYNQLLEDIGADIIELTGDHLGDWGSEAMTFTLDLYQGLGWQYYGGGYSLQDGREPLLIEHHGNRFAFLGCNAKPRGYATASPTSPGAVHCDFDYLKDQTRTLQAQGHVVIVTFQHIEYEAYIISPSLQEDFRAVADAGAQIVSGSQGHQPQGIEFYHGAFLHYGLGNLFFDQYELSGAGRQAFMDRHVFYAGKHISTELLTNMFTDLAHSRPMTADERQDLLRTIFGVSLWPYGE